MCVGGGGGEGGGGRGIEQSVRADNNIYVSMTLRRVHFVEYILLLHAQDPPCYLPR